MNWKVTLHRKVDKAQRNLPDQIRFALIAVQKEIEVRGPVIGWKGFGPLRQFGKDTYHCHMKSGKPTYVACWRVLDKQNKNVEIFYVGTHENAPY